jgi:hypothetical protein
MVKTKEKLKVPLDTVVFTTKFVLEEKKTITYVTHDIEDGAWQFFSDDLFENFEEVARIVGLQEIFEIDKSLIELSDIPLGYYATRKDKNDSWTIKKQEKK